VIGLAKLAPGRGNVGLAEREERAPGPGEVLLDVLAAGVCGTDLHIEAGEFRSAPPVTMGHEVCGMVAEVGKGVDPGLLEARVVSETYFSTCRTCEWCRDGRPNLCPGRRSIGSFVDGAFAPRLVVPAQNLHRIPDWLGEHAAALSEPLACVCHCLLDPARVTEGDDVLVTGPGPVGLLAAQVARAHGGRVLVAGLASDAIRLEAARTLGFEAAAVEEPASFDRYRQRLGADVVVECSGAAGGASLCLEHVRRGGKYVQIGVFGKPVIVPLDRVFETECTVTSGFASTPRSWRRALGLVERRAVVLEPLVSEVAPLSDWQRVFAALRSGQGVKVVFDLQRETQR
jgi:L-iditol 2-dehydrogenase